MESVIYKETENQKTEETKSVFMEGKETGNEPTKKYPETGNEPTTSGVVCPPIDNDSLTAAVVNADSGGALSQMLERKKRGRPIKCVPDGSLASPPLQFSSADNGLSAKRGRGRPPGSGNRQLLVSLGDSYLSSAGANFTPHVMTVNTGEDVAGKIYSFSHTGSLSVCILSANGSISKVAICQPGSSGGILTYEGSFEILSLSGCFMVDEKGDECSRNGMLSISLAGPDGRVIGGGVAGSLLAAGPIQVVVGSFQPKGRKAKRKPSLATAVSSVTAACGAAGGVTAATAISEAPAGDAENTNGRKPDSNAFHMVRNPRQMQRSEGH